MDGIYNTATMLGNRVKTNLGGSFARMSAEQWLRLVTIVCAYLLLRPYLLKLAERAQSKQYEREEARAEAEAAQHRARISPNELRGRRIDIPDDSESDDEDEAAQKKPAVAEWGKRARRRQRAVMRKMVEEHEKKLADAAGDEEDKDIEEFLVD